MKNVTLLLTLFVMTSCTNLIKKIHRSIDRQEKRTRIQSQRTDGDPYAMYRRGSMLRGKDRRPIANPVTFSRPNARAVENLPPKNRRQYRGGNRRYKANDLLDNGNQTSLWAGTGKDNYLFTNNDKKKMGDIIIVKVEKDLKNEISNELKRAFPVAVRRPKKKKKGEDEKEGQQPPQPNPQAQADEAEDKVYDKISTQVVEEISGDYLLLKGRKEVIFRKQKRYLEVQALVSRRDIYDGDKVESAKILEQKIFVLR